jgi:hypothetical protein
MDMFNSFIDDTVLIKIVREDSRFTWSNKERNPDWCTTASRARAWTEE